LRESQSSLGTLGSRGEVVVQYDARVKGGEIDLVDLLIDTRQGWKIMPPLSEALGSEDGPDALGVPFPERHGHASPQRLVDLVRGDECARGEASG